MRQEPEHFGDRELALVYIARKLKDALALEEMMTRAEIDYLVEADSYRGGVIFQSERVGAFFYVDPEREAAVREFLAANGYRAWTAD